MRQMSGQDTELSTWQNGKREVSFWSGEAKVDADLQCWWRGHDLWGLGGVNVENLKYESQKRHFRSMPAKLTFVFAATKYPRQLTFFCFVFWWTLCLNWIHDCKADALPLSHTSSPICSDCFGDGGLMNYLPPWNYDPPDFSFPIS
jgi:hypothetical protein